MTQYPAESEPWPVTKAGDICSDVCPGFVPGVYRHEALEDDSMELCLGGINAYGALDHGRFEYKKATPGPFTAPKGSVLVVATGSVWTEKREQEAPNFIQVIGRDIDVIMKGEGMWIARA